MIQEMTAVFAVQPITMACGAQKEKKEKAKDPRKARDKRKSTMAYADVHASYIHSDAAMTHYPTYGKDYRLR